MEAFDVLTEEEQQAHRLKLDALIHSCEALLTNEAARRMIDEMRQTGIREEVLEEYPVFPGPKVNKEMIRKGLEWFGVPIRK
jgi:hypothetical protein